MGTVTVISSDHTNPKLDIVNIKNPREFKELLHSQVEKMKLERRMHVGELIDDNDAADNGELN